MIDITTAWIIGSLITIVFVLLVLKMRLNHIVILLEKNKEIDKLKNDLIVIRKYIDEIKVIMNKTKIWEERLKLSFYQDQKDIATTRLNSLTSLLQEKINNLLRLE